MPSTSQRKADHIELCATGDVGFVAKSTLLDQVELLHDALPELRLADLDTTTVLLGKTLKAPIVIAAMTGGTPRAKQINRDLAAVAEARGYGFGLGSQRPMLEGRHEPSYDVRDVAPDCLLLGNLSAVQGAALATEKVDRLVAQVGADALCLHLNPAMELIQAEGDRSFVGVLDGLRRLSEELSVPVIAKETGCGLSWSVAQRLADAGVRHVDVSGAGGTSWVAVEGQRTSGVSQRIAEALRDWGVPTAASVVYAARAEPSFDSIIATGGLASGLDIARAVALGAHAAGMARAVLIAWHRGGVAAVERLFDQVEAELRTVMLLVGARSIPELRRAPRVLGGTLQRWISAMPNHAMESAPR
jgi:isopentenyl-diphosphate delta-isomerase